MTNGKDDMKPDDFEEAGRREPHVSVPGEETAPAAPAEEAQGEAARLKDQLLRALAEMENMRRRGERDREETAKYAVTGFAREMLSVADNLRRALENISAETRATDESLNALATGVEATERELQAILERFGVRRIDPLGQPFDPHFHQAIAEVPGTGRPPGTVAQVMRSGYVIHDRLLRPAMVMVAKGDPAAEPHVDTTA
jgi:molecular chaperone GrpE